ncbi:DUF1249 domain-containing protein [Methanosarcina mazei]|uniref:DUF6908 domain-containing protein n=1 Tax=Methanosarcina mazei TaxID=2209 RepID=A0A0F8I2B4_METMZ|nr:DUF1249 domain-containing protein [Methanosarcina mazei]KKG83071.1 hypothetical protein DU55_08205 [Methanosarcina mazei]
MDRKIYKQIFSKLKALGILNESGIMEAQYMRFQSPGLMDLHVDRLPNNTISLAHNGIQNGDIMADPDMQIWLHPDHKEAEAMTFQNDYVGVYQEVYPEPGKYKPKLKEELNKFLVDWLQNIIEVQKYTLIETKTEDE